MNIKINVPLSEADLFNIMKGGIYEWEQVPHKKDKEVGVEIMLYGEGGESLWKEIFDEYAPDEGYKHGHTK